MGKRVEFKRSQSQDQQGAKAYETTVYRVNITQFELSKLLYESEAFSRVELTASAKLFVWALCSHYNPDNKTMFPAQATVAKRLGMSSRSAERAVKELRDKGLVTYTTKRVNHYVFSAYFFELLGLAPSLGASGAKNSAGRAASANSDGERKTANGDILSDETRQNVGCGVRHFVGLTNKEEQKNKKDNFIFLNGVRNEKYPPRKAFGQNQWQYSKQQVQTRNTPSVEETSELLEKHAAEREKAVNPFDFSRAQAISWLKTADDWVLKHSKIAQHLVKKYALVEFEKA